MKLTAEMMGFMVCFNYPLTFILCVIKRDKLEYLIEIILMLTCKVLLAYLTSKIRVYLSNPRYSQNA